jgi:hypothetical protein
MPKPELITHTTTAAAEAANTPIHQLREAWLFAATEALRPVFVKIGHPIPDKVRVTCGFPSKRALGVKAKTIGQCWAPSASKDGTIEVMISPVIADRVEVMATLAHELDHAAVGVEAGHKGPFREVAVALGLEGPMRCTVAGDAFKRLVAPMLDALGPYPHAILDPSQVKKQSTRLLKAVCTSMEDADENDGKPCGYTVRVTKKWVIGLGAPHCPLHGEMSIDIPGEGEDSESEGEGY